MQRHHFTVDVEEYFQVSALAQVVTRASWSHRESRLERSLLELLDLLGRTETRGTFFILGWVADHHPALVRRIAGHGHEVASHGWDHRLVMDQEPAEFRGSVRRTRDLLEQLVGVAVTGFRAPSYSIVPGCEWALDVLVEEGYRYDSSLFPVRRPGGRYGYPDGRVDPHWLDRPAGRIAELPPATLTIGRWRVPAGGGAYFRILPYGLVSAALDACAARAVPGTFYIHPWELDPGQPRFDVPWLTHLRHYTGLGRTSARLERLLQEYHFSTMGETVDALCIA